MRALMAVRRSRLAQNGLGNLFVKAADPGKVQLDRKRVVWGKGVDFVGPRCLKKKN